MRDKRDVMRLHIKNGIRDLNGIRESYNSFASGGNIYDGPTERTNQMQTPQLQYDDQFRFEPTKPVGFSTVFPPDYKDPEFVHEDSAGNRVGEDSGKVAKTFQDWDSVNRDVKRDNSVYNYMTSEYKKNLYGRELHGDNYVRGADLSKDSELDKRFSDMVSEYGDMTEFWSPKMAGYSGMYRTGSNSIEYTGNFEIDPTVRVHENSHAFFMPKSEWNSDSFNERYRRDINEAKSSYDNAVKENNESLYKKNPILGELDKAGPYNFESADENYNEGRRNLLSDIGNRYGVDLSDMFYAIKPSEEYINFNNGSIKKTAATSRKVEKYKNALELKKSKLSGLDSYYSEPEEIRARVDSFRKWAIDSNGGVVPLFNKSFIDSKRNLLNERSDYNELIKNANLSDEDIIYMLNNLAKNSGSKQFPDNFLNNNIT